MIGRSQAELLNALLPLIAMLGVAPHSRSVDAQAGDSLMFLVVDTQKIYREAIALEQLDDELVGKRAADLDGPREKENELRVAARVLAAQRSVLPPEEFIQTRKALEQQMFTVRRDLQDRRRVIEQHFTAGMKRLQAQLSETAKKIAERRNAKLGIAKNAVVVVSPELEITGQALRELNERLPLIVFPMKENLAGNG